MENAVDKKQWWRISVKGYHPAMFKDSSLGRRHDGTSYMDTTYGYGYLYFSGTEAECHEEEMRLFKAGCKILGSQLWEPDTEMAELKKRVKSLVDKAYAKFWKIHLETDEFDPRLNRIWNGARDWSPEEEKAHAVYSRISWYYTKKFVTPYL